MIIWQPPVIYLRSMKFSEEAIQWFPMYVVIAGNMEELLLSPGSGLNLKLPDKMMLLTKKDLNLIGINCLLDICAKSDLSH